MATVLIVKAHPLDPQKSYALRALEEFETRFASLHPEDMIEIVDVFEDEIPTLDKPLLEAMAAAKKGEEIASEQAERLERYNAFTQQFLSADKIVVVNPLWNLNVPSQLVSWINTINVAGLTFKYGPEGSIGLIKDKKLLHIQSNGGVYAGQDPAAQYIKSIFEFLGFKDIQQVFIEGQSADPSQAQAIFEEAMGKIDNILLHF
ncbi:TPA: NAD(P)H-dependent oxidoreductase [Streptococcus suis]|jgi:FMN-dependent NADH-azoreductase|uniref:FMN dependent NADH:quinone oxidoreductase n=1 Tax=Streptococcus suis TaxID=1307 RepID=A0A9X4MKL5_STRSU|nr:NAD(P)H-dependent oxidoreductase [Streptococcus parasuis]MCA9760017.1 NAD(P)H-dependent oxidoreductase [Streptococcus sp.]MDG4511410.1 NAD(P)H-dependent oxidoreductase [Streptococcus suis]MDG4524095.1 NAD(P)H-dependent oxidoreductase [Streptococcus suis]ULL20716.1 FMN-dependent NADH-azoreductase [Streptococcus suis]WDN59084.1 NAD(P)H-dependent oxidoreductase [Streptococcus parasuis]